MLNVLKLNIQYNTIWYILSLSLPFFLHTWAYCAYDTFSSSPLVSTCSQSQLSEQYLYKERLSRWHQAMIVLTCTCSGVGRDSVVGIATRYGLEVRGSNPGGGEIFRSRPDWPWGPPSLLYNGYKVSFPGVKRPGRGVDHPPLLTPRLKRE